MITQHLEITPQPRSLRQQSRRPPVERHPPLGVYLLDEPTTGLHMSDVRRLLAALDRLIDGHGATVVVIEHNLDLVAHADWVIDLGPEAGSDGGRLVYEGTPAGLLSVKGSHTGEYLRRALEDTSAVGAAR